MQTLIAGGAATEGMKTMDEWSPWKESVETEP